MDKKKWFFILRPWSFIMSFISVSVGAVLASETGLFDFSLYLITLFGVVFFHAAANVINDYFDIRHSVDTPNAPTARYRPHPLVEKSISLKKLLILGISFFSIALSVCIYLISINEAGFFILILSLIGLFVALFYTADPFRLKYRGLGEFSVFLVWGPLMISGSYMVQIETVQYVAVIVSLPIGILVALVLLANNIRDIEHDRKIGVKTIPVLIGRKNSLNLFSVLIVLVYLSTFLLILLNSIPYFALLTFLSIPIAFDLIRTFRTQVPDDADSLTSRLVIAYGGLLLISLLLDSFRIHSIFPLDIWHLIL